MFQPYVKLIKAGPQFDSSQAKAERAGPVTGTTTKERGREKLNSATSINNRIPIGLGKTWCRRTALFDCGELMGCGGASLNR